MAAVAVAAGAGPAPVPGTRPATLLQVHALDRAVLGEGMPARDAVLQFMNLYNILQFRASCKESRRLIADYDCANIVASVPTATNTNVLTALCKALPSLMSASVAFSKHTYGDMALSAGFRAVHMHCFEASEVDLRVVASSLRTLSAIASAVPVSDSVLRGFGNLVYIQLAHMSTSDAVFCYMPNVRHARFGEVQGITQAGLARISQQLETLMLHACKGITSLPPLHNVRKLHLAGLDQVARLPPMPILQELSLVALPSLRTEGTWTDLATQQPDGTWTAQLSLTAVTIIDCPLITALPRGIRRLGWAVFQSIPDLSLLAPTLEILRLARPEPHVQIPVLGDFPKLQVLQSCARAPILLEQVRRCPSLRTLISSLDTVRFDSKPQFEQFWAATSSLQYLHMRLDKVYVRSQGREFAEFTVTPSTVPMRSLRALDCRTLTQMPGASLAQLIQLEVLNVSFTAVVRPKHLLPLRRLKVLGITVGEAVDADLLAFIISTPSLVAVCVESSAAVRLLGGKLRAHLQYSATAGEPIRVTFTRFPRIQTLLPFFDTVNSGMVYCDSPYGLTEDHCIVIHRAELKDWRDRQEMEWYMDPFA